MPGDPPGTPGNPPGIAGDAPGGDRGREAAGKPPGALFEKLPTISRSALKLQHRIAAKSKPKSMEGIAKMTIRVLNMFLDRYPNQCFEN